MAPPYEYEIVKVGRLKWQYTAYVILDNSLGLGGERTPQEPQEIAYGHTLTRGRTEKRARRAIERDRARDARARRTRRIVRVPDAKDGD